jgi:cytochrome c-type biogenesis protein CcmE
MTPRQRRMTLVAVIVAGVSLAAVFTLRAYRDNVTFYFDPTKVAAGEVKAGRRFRLGGMVVKGSLQREPGTLNVRFLVSDFKNTVPVTYANVLPDLFREGAGMVADGRLDASGVFHADEVLAKHDENYMPPAVARSLEQGKAAAAAGTP